MHCKQSFKLKLFLFSSTLFCLTLLGTLKAFASEADLILPKFNHNQTITLSIGLILCVFGFLFGVYQYFSIKKIKAHASMLDVAATIYETCKTYMYQQARLLVILFIFVGICIAFYFAVLQGVPIVNVLWILFWTIIGILGSFSVAFYGMRVNTLANSRMAYHSLFKKPLKFCYIPMNSGMSIGVFLISLELFLMLIILLLMRDLAGPCFIGFAIGESLGAAALRIAGGIFTKIADIGSDLMKIVFKIKEDDPRNPGVIADCTGDNAGDSVGPTADGFETYGVTGVALITFTTLAVGKTAATGPLSNQADIQSALLAWVFTMGVLMVISSVISFNINKIWCNFRFGKLLKFDFESPLSSLVWIGSVFFIILNFIATYIILGPGSVIHTVQPRIWWILAGILSCGTLGAALIPEFTKIFTSGKSGHVLETVEASKEGGASLNILAGFIAGNFSAFWMGLVFCFLMLLAYLFSIAGLDQIMIYPSVFAFGLVAFGFLSMGPVTIAVDSYGPVTDNAQSVYELSLFEEIPGIEEELEKELGEKPDFELAHYYLEANDGAGNTFKATAKPVLIGTAVVGSTIMIFSIILLLQTTLGIADITTVLNLLNPFTLMGFLCGGAVIYWFSGAATQAVATGAYRAVAFIKNHIDLDPNASKSAALENSKEVVRICTLYAQKGMFNIFVAIFSFALGFAFLASPARGSSEASVSFFISYLISIAFFGLFQAIFMANAGGSWDNAKKVVEVDLQQKGTPLHDASVIGDTVGDPFKDTSSVALNPIIKFTTLFGMLALEIAITDSFRDIAKFFGIAFLIVALIFVYRSFYSMRISSVKEDEENKESKASPTDSPPESPSKA
jgi:K(+)-stimulated pyrophosphate-energized sodium pump